MPDLCGCDFPEDCIYLELGYPYCHGCRDHHRAPVAPRGAPCPVDVYVAQLRIEMDNLASVDPEDFATTGPAESPPPF